MMSMAVHGESLHDLHWSDMFVSEITMDDVDVGLKILVRSISLTFCVLSHH
jgi:hypothetical protein